MCFVIAITIYLSLKSSAINFSFTPAWYIDQRKVSAITQWSGVPPIVTDLDGDGYKEIVMITKDLQLQILNAEVPSGNVDEIYSPSIVASARLNAVNLLTVLASVWFLLSRAFDVACFMALNAHVRTTSSSI